MRYPAAPQARPGADARSWVTIGVVKELGWDPTPVAGVSGGLFADVQMQPSGDIETCYVGVPYAGGGFGAWWPLEIDDTVIVVIPNGDSGYGPVIVGRFWNSGDLPPTSSDEDWAPGASALEPPADAVIRMKSGRAYKLRSSGASIDIRVEDSGDLVVENVGSGKVKLGLAADAEPIALASLVEAAIKSAVEEAIQGHSHAYVAGPPAGTFGTGPGFKATPPATAPTAPYVASVDSTAATKTEAT